jgi:Flp pilus assembly protein TadG
MDPTHPTLRRLLRGDNRGQSIVEFTLFGMVLVLLFCGLIDFSRIIRDRLILINLSREGSSLASRGTSMTNAVTDVINDAYPLNMNNGRVIISSVFNSNGTYIVTAQATGGGLSGVSSLIGSVGGRATLPATSVPLPQLNQYLYVTEVYWPFTTLTPIGRILRWTVPSVLYDVAYF